MAKRYHNEEEVLAAIFADSGSECAESDDEWTEDDKENRPYSTEENHTSDVDVCLQSGDGQPSDVSTRDGWHRLHGNEFFSDKFDTDFDGVPGLRENILENAAPVDYFFKFFPQSIFGIMSEETNRYAFEYFDHTADLQPQSRFLKWKDTTEDEMKRFVALEIAMGLCQKPTLQSYWDEWWLTQTVSFSNVMSRNRFQLLRSFLHFNDNSLQVVKGQPGFDCLFKVRPLITLVKDTYLGVYQPHRFLSIDETMRKFKGRVSFKQYMPNKPNKWGIKIWSLCDSVNGFNLKWKVYIGKETESGENGLGFSVVKELLSGLDLDGYKVFMDNFFSSPNLFDYLLHQNIGACGTVRSNRKGLPVDLQTVKLKKGDNPVFWEKGNILLTTWQDTARVNAISTFHDSSVVDKEVRNKIGDGVRNLKKPALIEDYNKYMGGVDRFDQLCSYYQFPHKSQKWYQVIYHFITETALVNAFILFHEDQPTIKMDQVKFRRSVIDSLISHEKRLPVKSQIKENQVRAQR